MAVLTTKALNWVPSAAAGVTLTPSGVAWTNSSWVQLIASTANAIQIDSIEINAGNSSGGFEIDIGIGGSGSEVAVTTYRGYLAANTGFGYTIPLVIPIDAIPSGSRVSCRLRFDSTSVATWTLALGYYNGDDSSNLTTQPSLSVPSAASSVSLTGNGSAWANSSWVELVHLTALAIWLSEITVNPGSADEFEIDIGTGGAGSEVVVSTIRGNAVSTTIGNNFFPLYQPLQIATSTRIAVRIRLSSTSVSTWKAGAMYYNQPTLETQTGKANISSTVTTPKTQTGVARIAKIDTKTQTGISRIQNIGQRLNFIYNPSFEVNITDNTSFLDNLGVLTASLDTTTSAVGSNSAKLVLTSNADTNDYQVQLRANDGHQIPLLAGHTYTFSAYIKSTDSRNVTLGTENGAWNTFQIVSTTTSWARYSMTFTPVSDTINGFHIFVNTGNAGTVWIDGMLAEEAGSMQSYFDGSSIGGAWLGTVNNSFSTLRNGVVTGVAHIVPGWTIEVPIEMLESLYQSPNGNPEDIPNSYIRFDPTAHDNATYYLEIVADNNLILPGGIQTLDTQFSLGGPLAGHIAGSEITVLAGVSTPTRYRSGAFFLSQVTSTSFPYWHVILGGGSARIYSAKLIVQQANPTKTRVQIPLMTADTITTPYGDPGGGDLTTSTSFIQATPDNYNTFLLETSKFQGLSQDRPSFELEVFGGPENTGSIAEFSLFDRTTGNQVKVADIIVDFVPSFPLSVYFDADPDFIDGHEYWLKFRLISGSGNAFIKKANLYINISPVVSGISYYRTGNYFSGSTSDDMLYHRSLLNSLQFINPIFYFETVAHIASGATNDIRLEDAGTSDSATGSDVTGSSLSITGLTPTRYRSGALTLTSTHRYYAKAINTSGQVVNTSSFLLVNWGVTQNIQPGKALIQNIINADQTGVASIISTNITGVASIANQDPPTRTYNYIENLPEQTTVSTIYQDAATLTFTPVPNSQYIILATWEIGANADGVLPFSKLTRTNGTPKDWNILSPDLNHVSYMAQSALGNDSFGTSPTSQTYKVQFKSNVGSTIKVRNVRIIALKLETGDVIQESAAKQSNSTTSYTAADTLVFTPATATNYIIIAVASLGNSLVGNPQSSGTGAQLIVGGQGNINASVVNTSNNSPNEVYNFAAVQRASLSAVSQTIKIQFKAVNAGGIATIQNTTIVALRADGFNFDAYNVVDTNTSTSSSAYVNKVAISQSPQPVTHLILSSGVDENSQIGYLFDANLAENNVTIGSSVYAVNSPVDRTPHLIMYVKKFDGTPVTWANQYKQDTFFSPSLGFSRLEMLQLDAAFSVVTQTQIGVASIATDRTQTGVGNIKNNTLQLQTGKSAILNAPITRLQTGKGNLQYQTLKTQTGIARITITSPRTQVGKSRIGYVTPKTQTGVTRITLVTPQTQTAVARITASTPKTQVGKSRITRSTPQTITAVGRVGYVTPKTQTAVARITISTPKTQTAITRITAQPNKSLIAVARIMVSVKPIQLGKSRITATTPKTQTAVARLLGNVSTSRAQTGVGNIKNTSSKTQTGLSRITDITPKTQTGISRIALITPKTQTGVSRLTKVAPRTQTGVAHIQIITDDKTQTAVARMTATVPKTQVGKSRITTSPPKTQVGKGDIKLSTPKTQTGISRITIKSIQLQIGKGAIKKTTQRTQTGKGSLTFSTQRMIAGVANMRPSTPQPQTGRAAIKGTTLKTQTAKASLLITTDKTTTGIANILPKGRWFRASKSSSPWQSAAKSSATWGSGSKPSTQWQ